MSGNFIIRDKTSGKFWTGTEWHTNWSEAKMFSKADDAIEIAKGLKGDLEAGAVEVIDGYRYDTPRVVWSA